MNLPPSVRIAMLSVLFLCSCGKRKEYGIEYEESSLEQSVEAATAAFAESGEKVATEPEIEAFFLRMGRTVSSSASFSAEEFISIGAMLETAESAGLLAGLSASEKRGFRKGFHKAVASQMPASLSQMAYDRHRIARVEKPAENRRIVYANHYDNELNVTTPMRWWLIRTEKGWRIHDFEDLSFGLRAVGLMGVMMKAGVGKNPEPWIKDFLPVVRSFQQMDMADLDSMAELREPLDRLLKHDLPDDIRRFASAVLVSAHMAEGEFDKAGQELEDARKGGYASPLARYQMGHVFMGREEYSKALEEFAEHVKAMGEDSDILESVSDCHFQLGDMVMARAAAERALDDNASSLNCLASLAAASTQGQLADAATTARFEASGDPAAAYEMALDYLLSLDETEKARILYQTARKSFEDEELLEYYDEELAQPAGD
jgi:Tfp pilus assembly protein PilF